MRYRLTWLALLCTGAIVFMACNNAGKGKPGQTDSIPKKDSVMAPLTDSGTAAVENETRFIGIYTGDFEGSPISIVLNYISGGNASGYNIHKGLKRNIRGKIAPAGSMLKFVLDEPGNNKYDGRFDFYIDTATLSGRGKWTAMVDTTIKAKNFTIAKKKKEEYDPINSIMMDSASNQTFWLKEDGSCEFAYYQNDSSKIAQQNTIIGNWQLKGDSVIVFWQKNEKFPARKSAFIVLYYPSDDPKIKPVSNIKGNGLNFIPIGG
jgi:hypothetical protein